MKINIYQAECGDAIRIKFIGNDQKPHNIFIDSGYERTYNHVIEAEIRELICNKEFIDLWIVSHIHDDHIGGITAYIASIRGGAIKDVVSQWYYNSPRSNQTTSRSVDEISSAKSIEQGDYLNQYLGANAKVLNHDIVNTLPSKDINGLKLTILSPDDDTLKKLRAKYSQPKFDKLSYHDITEISEATSVKKHDYETLARKFDLSKWTEDSSIENKSSIAVLAQYKTENVLFLADSHPSVIVKALKKLGYSKENPIKCSWVMVTHHGSKANNSSDLYEHIKCNNYILSVNGENKHYLPTKESIVRILASTTRGKDSHYKFFFTYDNETLRSIFKVDGEEIYKDLNFSLVFQNEKKIVIDL